MIITDFLERNARLYGGECALVEINPSEERDKAVTWVIFSGDWAAARYFTRRFSTGTKRISSVAAITFAKRAVMVL